MTVKIVVPTSGSLLGIRFRRRKRRAENARLIAEMRGTNLRLAVQERRKIREALADRAPEDEEVGPEQGLHPIEIDVDPVHPGPPVEIEHGLDVGRSIFLRVHAVQLHVAELRVGEEPAVDEERRADAGAEGQHDDGTPHTAAGAETHLGETRRVRVVEEERIAVERAPDERGTVGTDPGMIDVGGGARPAASDDGGKSEAHAARGLGELRSQRGDGRHHRLGARGLGCRCGDDLTHQTLGRNVHHPRLDEGAPDVDAQQFLRHRPFSGQRLVAAASCMSRSRRLCRRRIHNVATTTPLATTDTMRVASAFTSGLTPSRTLEKITMGSVLDPGPATNCEMTRSSHERVKASSHPASTAGRMSGSVMRQNTFAGRAPRSCAASSSDSSNPARRDCITTVTYAMQNEMCASVIVSAPIPRGQPMACCRATKSSSNDSPLITSGMTMGAVVIPTRSERPRKAPNRARAVPARMPRIVETVAAQTATRSDSQAASSTCPSEKSTPYHLRVGECAASQTVTRRLLLKEYTIIDRMGT